MQETITVNLRDPFFLGILFHREYRNVRALEGWLISTPANAVLTFSHEGTTGPLALRDWCIRNGRAYHTLFLGSAYVAFSNEEHVANEALVRLADEVFGFGADGPDEHYYSAMSKVRVWGKLGGTIHDREPNPKYKTR